MPEKAVEIKISENLKLFNETQKFQDFDQIKIAMVDQIHELMKNSTHQNKWNSNLNVKIYDEILEKLTSKNFYKTIIRMFTMESCLYTTLNNLLKTKNAQNVPFYYASVQAALKFYESTSYNRMKNDGIFKKLDQKAKYIEVFQGSYISVEDLEIYKGLCSSDQVSKIRILKEFLSASFSKEDIEAFFEVLKEKKLQVLHIFKLPLHLANLPFIYLGGELNGYPTSKECLIKSGSLTEITKIEKINENRVHIYHIVYRMQSMNMRLLKEKYKWIEK